MLSSQGDCGLGLFQGDLFFSPKLVRAQRYAQVARKRAEPALLAANPELIAARRHTPVWQSE